MSNILVLGNGFDLYHGLKTKYYDFVQFVKNPYGEDISNEICNMCKENTFLKYFIKVCEINDNWINCEEEIERVILVLQKISDINRINRRGRVLLNSDETSNLEYVIMEYLEKYGYLQNAHCFQYKEEYFTETVFNKKKILQDFRQELNQVIEVLAFYLKMQMLNVEEIPQYMQIRNIRFNNIINFNYTNTYSKVYCNETPVFYQHGSLNNYDSMVLGVPDNDDIDLDFVYFKKYFQRIQKRSGILSKEIPNLQMTVDSGETIYFLGMSMGKTDEDLIKQIMQYSPEIKIFYYDQNDYEGKVINLIDILGRKQLEEWIEDGTLGFIKLNGE